MTGTSDQTGEEDRALVPSVFDRLDRLERQLERADAERLLLCLDFDGTLAPHVDDPASAELTAENRRVLEALSRQPAVDIAVISGRALNDVRDRVGIDGFDYAGNHGLEFEESEEGGVATEHYRSAIQSVCADLQARFEGTDCEVENKSITATVHYRNASVTEDRVRSVIKESIDSTDEELQVLSGTNIVEIRPAIDWDKGRAVQQFEERDEYLPVYVGDDTTDEDAFRAIASEGISVHVGSDRDTAAKYRVSGVDDVTSFLDWIAETGIDAVTTDTEGR